MPDATPSSRTLRQRASVLDCGGPPPLWNGALLVNKANKKCPRAKACGIWDEPAGWQDEPSAKAPEGWRTPGRFAMVSVSPARQPRERRPRAAFESAQRNGFFAVTSLCPTKDPDAQSQFANPSSDSLKIVVSRLLTICVVLGIASAMLTAYVASGILESNR